MAKSKPTEVDVDKETISKVMSELGKLSHKKKPRPAKFYEDMQKKRVYKKKKKFSTGNKK